MNINIPRISWRNIITVGTLLGVRQVKRSSFWMNLLIILIMTLTFLNMVVVPGILIGLIEGGNQAFKQQYAGDIFISEQKEKPSIEKTSELRRALDSLDGVDSYSIRTIQRATVEANFQSRRLFDVLPNQVGTSVVGIHPEQEDTVSNLSDRLVEGEYLDSQSSGYILIGATLLKKYSKFSDLFDPLEDVSTGSTVKITLGNNTAEFIVKGVVKTKVDEVSLRVFMNETDYKRLSGAQDTNANEIAVRIHTDVDPRDVQYVLKQRGFDEYAKIQTYQEAIPKFLGDIKITFGILGNVIGSIGIIVSAITIFVVIYINALTRRKYIGILKGIGIHGSAITMAYIIQAMYYALFGIAIGLVLIYGLMVPFFLAHPLDFPFSDGILVAPLETTVSKMTLLLIVTALASLIPSSLIVRKNTLSSILGR